MTLIALVGLPSADGMPPQVAQVPIAIVAAEPGASRLSHSVVGIIRDAPPSASPDINSDPIADQ